MKKNFKLRISTLLLIVILVVFAVLLIVNETKLFKNDVNYSFDEAVSMQQGKGIVQTKEEDGKFVEANNNEIAKAMTISHKDNDMKYMDITEKVPMSESEVNQLLKGKGILENRGKVFLEAQEKYEVNVIYLVSHALVETGNGKSELAKGIKDGKKRYYNFEHSIVVLFVVGKVMLKRNNGHHQIRRLLVVQSSFVMNILKTIN